MADFSFADINPNVLALSLGGFSKLFNPGGAKGQAIDATANMAISLAQQQQQAQLLSNLLGGTSGQTTPQAPVPGTPSPKNLASASGQLDAAATPATESVASGSGDMQKVKMMLLAQALMGGSSTPFVFPQGF